MTGYHQRKMDNATVEGDCIGEIIYRNICPSDSKRETKSIVKGKVQLSLLVARSIDWKDNTSTTIINKLMIVSSQEMTNKK